MVCLVEYDMRCKVSGGIVPLGLQDDFLNGGRQLGAAAFVAAVSRFACRNAGH